MVEVGESVKYMVPPSGDHPRPLGIETAGRTAVSAGSAVEVEVVEGGSSR